MFHNAVDLEMLSLAQLAAVYNSGAETPVKKFGTRQLGLQRVRRLQEELQRPVVSVNGEYRFAEVAAPSTEEEDQAALERALVEANPPAPVEERLAAAVEETGVPATAEEPESAASPEPEVKRVPTPYEIQQARKAKKARAPKPEGDAPPRAGRGEYAETQVLRVLKPVQARDGSARAARFSALRDGTTVGAYLDAAWEANGKRRPRHRYHSDVRRLVEAGHLAVE